MNDGKWKIVYTKHGLKDKQIAFEAGFSGKINSLLDIVRINPFEEYPPYEKNNAGLPLTDGQNGGILI